MGITGDFREPYGGVEKLNFSAASTTTCCRQCGGCCAVNTHKPCLATSFKGAMKGLKKIRKRIGFVSRSHSGVGSSNLPPVRFHPTHGTNISLHKNRTVARRQESFCKGLTFTDRPIGVDEKVYVKLIDISDNWSGVIRFGYTSHDPITLKDRLPKYACPDLTNQSGFWAKAVNERLVDKDLTLYFYVNKNGSVYYGIDGRPKDEFFQGVDVSGPLWAMIDVYGNSTAIELVNVRLNNSLAADQEAGFALNDNNNARCSDISEAELTNEFRRLSCHSHPNAVRERCNQPPAVLPIPANNGARAPRAVIESPDPGYINHLLSTMRSRADVKSKQFDLKLTPLPFHEKYGLNVRLSSSKLIASRLDTEYCRGYVFTPRPIGPNEFIVLEVLKTDSMYMSGLAFGVTSENPGRINVVDLPEDADELIDRTNSFIVYKNVANTPCEGDTLIFSMTENGEVKMKKNSESEVSLFHVERNVSYWWFFDLYGSTTKIRAFSGTLESQYKVSSPPLSCQKIMASPTMSSSDCVMAPIAPVASVAAPSEYPRNHSGALVSMNGGGGHSSGHAVINGSQPVLVVSYSGGMEPINIILQNQPTSGRIIAQASQPVSSHLPGAVRSHALPSSDYASIHTLQRNSFDNSMSENGRNREYQLQEWAKSNSRNHPGSIRPNECTVCYEKPVDAVLYTCGHMCLCYDCARELWRGSKGDGHCPICRAIIKDVIRTYKS